MLSKNNLVIQTSFFSPVIIYELSAHIMTHNSDTHKPIACFGFIVLRHVNSARTNLYWNRCVSQIRTLYPGTSVVIIDDNSNKLYLEDLHSHYTCSDVSIIDSEYPGAGELLPYYYLHARHLFDYAAIIHDSVFVQKKIMFQQLAQKSAVCPLWHFYTVEDPGNCVSLASRLKNSIKLQDVLRGDQTSVFNIRRDQRMMGCFGAQTVIQRSFLEKIQQKYSLFSLISVIRTRRDRMSLERVMGTLFMAENPDLLKHPSVFGNIWKHQRWGTTYEAYTNHRSTTAFQTLPLVKVWSGR